MSPHRRLRRLITPHHRPGRQQLARVSRQALWCCPHHGKHLGKLNATSSRAPLHWTPPMKPMTSHLVSLWLPIDWLFVSPHFRGALWGPRVVKWYASAPRTRTQRPLPIAHVTDCALSDARRYPQARRSTAGRLPPKTAYRASHGRKKPRTWTAFSSRSLARFHGFRDPAPSGRCCG